VHEAAFSPAAADRDRDAPPATITADHSARWIGRGPATCFTSSVWCAAALPGLIADMAADAELNKPGDGPASPTLSFAVRTRLADRRQNAAEVHCRTSTRKPARRGCDPAAPPPCCGWLLRPDEPLGADWGLDQDHGPSWSNGVVWWAIGA